MKNSKELLENIIKSVVETTFSNKIEVAIDDSLSFRKIEIPEFIAEILAFKNGEVVRVKTEGIKALIFENVKIFVNKNIEKKRFFISIVEAKAANLENGVIVEILKEQKEQENYVSKEKNKKNKVDYKFEKDGIYVKLT